MDLDYILLDVFTDTPLSGNPLAVVQKADELSDSRMQAIAAEFNLSETVFVCKPENERHTARLRIFTPRRELPFAGHPTIGMAALLGINFNLTAARLEENVGLVTCLMERESKRMGRARFSLPKLPERVDTDYDLEAVGAALGVGAEAIGCGAYAPTRFDAGNPFHLIPVRDAHVLRNVSLDRGAWAGAFPGDDKSVYLFTETPEERENDLAARMFSPSMGIGEDPATGSAVAALAGLLAEQLEGTQAQQLRIRQGVEMGRPSLIELELQVQDGRLGHALIGGAAVVVGSGTLYL